MKKLLIAGYVLAAISTAQSSYIIDVRSCRTAPPIQYAAVGGLWPVSTALVGWKIMVNDVETVRRSACK